MSDNGGSWLKRIAACVHEDIRDPRKAERYRAMIREWAGEMAQYTRPATVSVREKLKRKPYCWPDEQIEQHLELYDDVLPDGTKIRTENPEVIQHDPISITTHSGTSLNKKYATLAAIHDDCDHCDFPINPWADGSPGTESVSDDEKREMYLSLRYVLLKGCVETLTDDEQANVKRMLADVAEDLEATLRNDADGEVARRSPAVGLDPDAWLGSSAIASKTGVPAESLRKRLDRLRKTDDNCYREVADSERKPNEPQYLYHVRAVLPIIEALKASGKTSGQRPAKKN